MKKEKKKISTSTDRWRTDAKSRIRLQHKDDSKFDLIIVYIRKSDAADA